MEGAGRRVGFGTGSDAGGEWLGKGHVWLIWMKQQR